MAKKRDTQGWSSFDSISKSFETDGHDTIVSESKLGNIDNDFKKGKKAFEY